MKYLTLTQAAEMPQSEFVAWLEKRVRQAGLVIHGRDTLKKYPGSIHWHFTFPGGKGTLEATYIPSEKRGWLSYHDNRRAWWIDDTLQKITGTAKF
ncbi:MAG: hypothetical protein SGI97_00340 [candidate division Zixibacteria bacterium]|nr:hypothetical protein [candidate division Zixibacteria bacterium]